MTNSRLDRTPNSDVREMEEIDLLELFRAILKCEYPSDNP